MEALFLRVCNTKPSLMLELFEGEVVEGAGNHPPGGGSAPDWCVCGRCRQMPTELERVCCGMSPAHCSFASILIMLGSILSQLKLGGSTKVARYGGHRPGPGTLCW